MKKILLTFVLALLSQFIFAINTGTIRGTVIDKTTGETIPFATIILDSNTMAGTTTDIDGNFTLIVKPGKHKIKVLYTGMDTKNLVVEVKEGEESILNISLSEKTTEITGVEIFAKIDKSGDMALEMLKKESTTMLDGVSSETFKKSGASSAASAVKLVTGVSIEGGKYVYVRGLGDRYTKTTLNGMTIPGLNPDKNTVQMDLFPTNLIDNIVVYKTFMPDLPGDFTGGLVNVVTKDFPEQKSIVFSTGFGHTTGMNFNPNFTLYNKGKIDWLGFAGNTRELHFNPKTVIPDETQNEMYLYDLSKGFNKELGVKKGAPTFLNQKYAFSFGNQFAMKKVTLGMNVALNYSNKYTFYKDVYQGNYLKDSESKEATKLDLREESKGTLGQNETLWSALLAGAMKYKENQFSVSLIHSQNGVGKAANYISQNYDATNATLYKHAIEYSQKSVTNLLLAGKHELNKNKWNINWKLSPTYSNILEPDVRSTRLSYDSETETYDLKLGDGAGIDRYYRTLNEINFSTKADATYNFKQWKGEESKLKFGISNSYKNRDYQILLYQFNKTTDFKDFTEDPNDILVENNLWTPTSQSGMYVVGNRDLNNEYQATANTLAVYAMNELPISKKLKTIYGLRAENASINYKGHYNNLPIDSLVHNEFTILPSVNFIYKIKENMNLRSSFSKTVARPSFKEKSNAHIDDPISQTVFIGNIALKETDIYNIDVRWEYFFKSREMISVSGFYKNFLNPIELVPFVLSPNNIQPKNIDQATVYGVEIELKKRLTPNDNKLKIDFGTNITYLTSIVNIKKVKVDVNRKSEYQLRKENARTGETISTYRSMQGQAPFIINAYLNFASDSTGLEANISYNVQGKRLAIVGSGIVPDVVEDPFHSLNFKGSYRFGKNNNMKLSLSVKNILGDTFKQYYDSFEAEEAIYRSYSKGRGFSIGFSYKL